MVAAVLEENLVGLVDLGAERVRVLDQVQQIRVVHLEQHASELASLLWVDVGDDLVEVVSEDLLLAVGLSRGQERGKSLHLGGLWVDCNLWGDTLWGIAGLTVEASTWLLLTTTALTLGTSDTTWVLLAVLAREVGLLRGTEASDRGVALWDESWLHWEATTLWEATAEWHLAWEAALLVWVHAVHHLLREHEWSTLALSQQTLTVLSSQLLATLIT